VKNNPHHTPVAVIGYSGHGFVAIDILLFAGYKVTGYFDREEKQYNPFALEYFGKETDSKAAEILKENSYFIAIGDNLIREKIYLQLTQGFGKPVNAIHLSAVISSSAKLQDGIMIAAGAVINPLVTIGKGVICNTSCAIDHECEVGDFSHIAPGAILCGNVKTGQRSFIGAGAVIRQGIRIGNNVMIGAGCVVVKDVPDNTTMVGNPQKELVKNKIKDE
jgi:sugar O-acyltransferase (sialic acid O-acetyltransferase NeuD family)